MNYCCIKHATQLCIIDIHACTYVYVASYTDHNFTLTVLLLETAETSQSYYEVLLFWSVKENDVIKNNHVGSQE